MAKLGKFHTVLSAVEADGFGTSLNVDQYDEIVVEILTEDDGVVGPATGVVNCYGSVAATEPTWASPATPANPYFPVYMFDLNTGSGVVGTTGVPTTATNIIKQFRVNVDTLRFINLALSGWGAGTWTVRVRGIEKSRF